MAPEHYHVITRWTVDATTGEVAEIFEDFENWVDWWPAAFLRIDILRRGGDARIGQMARVHAKGWLPYTLRFHSTVTAAHSCGFCVVVTGDFDGRGIGEARARGSKVEIVFDWQVRVAKPLVRRLSFLFRCVFVANHLWVMARGQQSLILEIERRRRRRLGLDTAAFPAPPGPTFRPTSRQWGLARLFDGRAAHDFLLYRRMFRSLTRFGVRGSALPDRFAAQVDPLYPTVGRRPPSVTSLRRASVGSARN
jgi:hypothetical protein